jgi:hypothetical protein
LKELGAWILIFLAVIGLIFFSLAISGCAGIPFTSSPSPKMSESWSRQEDITPVAVGLVNGKQVALNETHRSVAVNREVVGQKKRFFQAIWAWFAGLGMLGGALAFFFPTVFFAIALWLLKKWNTLKREYALHKTALLETVKAVKVTGVVDKDKTLHDKLDDIQSEETKKLIAQLRATL